MNFVIFLDNVFDNLVLAMKLGITMSWGLNSKLRAVREPGVLFRNADGTGCQ